MDRKIYKEIGAYCRTFRMVVLKLTLDEISPDMSIKTLSSFENGRSSNLIHLTTYVNFCETQECKEIFLNGLLEVIEKCQ